VDSEQEERTERRRTSDAKRWYDKTKILWIVLIVVDLTVQSLRTATMSPTSIDRLSKCIFVIITDVDVTETIATFIFAAEIVVRFAVSFPNWRAFFYEKSNDFDLFLAIATMIIQIPRIRNSSAYGWLTIFQILRVHRIIMAVPITRILLVPTHHLPFVYSIVPSSQQCLRNFKLGYVSIPDDILGSYPRLSVDPGGYSNSGQQW
jgi:voltage-dependent calcium channel